MHKIERSHNRVAGEITHWFLTYHRKGRYEFDGSETFTLFEHIPDDYKGCYTRRMDLSAHEIPVLLLSVAEEEYIVCTTERFIYLHMIHSESIYYKNFKRHKGFDTASLVKGSSKEGSLAMFGITRTDRKTVYWKMPTGKTGLAFSIITEKCKIIGSQYKLVNY
jgi:hypothetical protein